MVDVSHLRALRFAGLVLAAIAVGSCKDSTAPPSGSGSGPVPAFVVVTPALFRVSPLASVVLTVQVLDKDSALIAGATVTFASSDTTLLKVSAAGSAGARAKVGLGQITVSSGNVHTIVPFQVAGTPVQILLAPTDTTIREGGSFQYRFKAVDSLGDSIRYLPLTFGTDDSLALQVTPAGVATGRSGGSETVDVGNGVLSEAATVTVNDTNVVARIPLGNAPYGVGAGAGGLVYVAPIIGTSVFRIGLPGGSLADSVVVGPGNPSELALDSAADTMFVTKRAAGSVGIISVFAKSQVDSLIIPGEPYSVLLGAGRTAFVGTAGTSMVYKVDLSTRAVVDSLPIGGDAIHMAMGAGDSLFYVAEAGAGAVLEVDPSSMTVIRTFSSIAGTVQDVATSPDGAELYVADEAGGLHVVTLSSGSRATVATRGGTFGVTVSPDGQTIAVGTVAGFIYCLDRTTHAVKHRVWVGGTPRLLRVDGTTGLTVVANEGSSEVDVVR